MSFKRRVLGALGKEELLETGRALGLEVAARMTVDALRDTIARSKRARLPTIVREDLSRDTLKEICTACGLDDGGREKAVLVARILEAGGAGPGDDDEAAAGSAGYRIDRAASKGTAARDGTAQGNQLGLGLLEAPTGKADGPRGAKAAKAGRAGGRKGKGKPLDAGGAGSEALVSGSLKAALRQFALGAAGGYRGRDASVSFVTHLLACFGWKDGRPDGAEIPRVHVVAEAGQRVEREVTLWWPARRAMLDVADGDAGLDGAWKDLVRVCLQLDPVPQYVVLTNQRDLHLYDLARDREAPRLAIALDDLPKYSEAFPFFTTDWVPGATPKIVNIEKVSAEVADLVARLYRSVLARHPGRERDVIRFTLQCITAMFAEDIGLLPKSYFTSLLYDGARAGNVEARLHELFVQMNTRDLPSPRVVPYFNGGLFTEAASLPLGSEQVIALTKAAEANWTYVDPHIFGSVFQGIMSDAERHASGAHYTAHDDIMRVVGPTIVEPWRKRLAAAASLAELTALRKELHAYRVLDPACGSGNFLYAAFRELYRLDTELLSRMREFPSTQGKLSWNGAIPATNFHGIDINPFAVELAKVTLNIARKIAFEERRAQAFALAGQVEMEVDPSLPLDNLDDNIVCADALFTDWPAVDAIVGNPPFLGGQKIRRELGPDYVRRLQAETGAEAVVDLACYWFRRAHDSMQHGARAGFVATSGIRVGSAREASLDYIVANGGTIANAISSRVWPGESAVNVCMVNWIKAHVDGPFHLIVDEHDIVVDRIPTHLQLHADVSTAIQLRSSEQESTIPTNGVMFGHEAFRSSGQSGFHFQIPSQGRALRAVATGDDLLRGRMESEPDYCIYFANADEGQAKKMAPLAFEHLRKHVYPWLKSRADSGRESGDYSSWLRKWWKPQKPREDFFRRVGAMHRLVVCPKVSARPSFVFISQEFVPNNTMWIFAFRDDYAFGVLQGAFHWEWIKAKGGRTREDFTYSTEVWRTFPWPQDPTDEQVAAVAAAGRALRKTRDTLMAENGWSLRQLYQAAEVEGPHPLKDAQAALDAAVAAAYGAPPDQSPTEFLLELNQLVAEDEEQGRKVRGPGLPDHLDPSDPRWISTDCIEPPPLDP